MPTYQEVIVAESMQEFQQLQTYRNVFAEQWEEIAQLVVPTSRNTFYYGSYKFPGMKLTDQQIDSSASVALWRFGAILDSLLTPANITWHTLQAEGDYVKKDRRAKLWFEQATRALFKYRYAPDSNFAAQNQNVYQSLGAFGTGPMFVDQLCDEAGNLVRGLRYMQLPLGEIFMRQNHQGLVNGFCRWFRLTPQEAVTMFGDDLPPLFKEQAAKSAQTPFDFLHRVCPRKDYDPDRKDMKGKKFASYYISLTTNEFIREGGYRLFPLCASRYIQGPGEVYGRSPAMLALPSIKTINAMKRDQLTQSHRAATPVFLTEDDGIASLVLRPGSMNPGGMRDGKPTIGTVPIGEPQVLDDAMAKETAIIDSVFLVDLFKVLLGDPKIFTATQIVEMMSQRGILIAPTVGRQRSEYLGPLIHRELDLLVSMRLLDPMPPSILEARGEYKVQYQSPLSRDMRAQEVAGFQRTLDTALAVSNATGDPSVFDSFAMHRALPDQAEINGVPESWMASPEEVQQKAQARADAQKRQEQIQAAPAQAALIKANATATAKGAQMQPQPMQPGGQQ